MTEDHDDPWKDISPATGDLVGRRVDDSHPLNFYWAKDFGGKCLLVLTEDCVWPASNALPKFDGITLELRHDPRLDRPSLVLALTRENDRQIFQTLCEDIIRVTRRVVSSEGVVGLILGRLEKWKRLLKSTPSGILSENEIIGLFGELICIRDEIATCKGIVTAINSWHGPEGARQDFSINNIVVEVKTKLTTAQHSIEISSEEQLEPLGNAALYLLVITVGKAENSSAALSVLDLVGQLKSLTEIESPSLCDLFESKLAQIGFVERQEYALPKFVVLEKKYYSVGGGFPRIVTGDLETGISRVRYLIELQTCALFIVDRPWSA